MNKIRLIIATILIFLISLNSFAQEGEKTEIPPGMEVIQDGRIKVIVPEDAKRRKVGNLTVVETAEAYLSRRFLEMEKRFAELQAREERLEKEVEQLKKALDKIQIK